MFRRLDKNLPVDPAYPADLARLGFMLNDELQIVAKGNTVPVIPSNSDEPKSAVQHGEGSTSQSEPSPRFFDFFHTSSERANEMRKEAMHTCARKLVLDELQKSGVSEVFLSGEDGSTITEDRPDGPHVSILINGHVNELSTKKNILLVVGEASQDLGIWAYRMLMRQGGIKQGSAVNLAHEVLLGGRLESKGDRRHLHDESELLEEMDKLHLQVQLTDASPGRTSTLVILNPGQLLYSYSLHCNMATTTWLARPRPSAISDPHKIDDVHNRVAGHRTASEHLQTCLSLIPSIFDDLVNLYIVCVGEGAEMLLNFIEADLRCDKEKSTDGSWYDRNIKAIAMCQPTHRPTLLHNPALIDLLAKKGMSWVMDAEEKDVVITSPVVAIASAAKVDYAPGFDADGQKTGVALPTDINQLDHPDQPELRKTASAEDTFEPVSCTTKSAGPGIDVIECVWPAVMDSVLDFFAEMGRTAEAKQ